MSLRTEILGEVVRREIHSATVEYAMHGGRTNDQRLTAEDVVVRFVCLLALLVAAC